MTKLPQYIDLLIQHISNYNLTVFVNPLLVCVCIYIIRCRGSCASMLKKVDCLSGSFTLWQSTCYYDLSR